MCSPCPPLPLPSPPHCLHHRFYVTARVKVRAAIIDYLINHCTFADVSLLFSQNAAAFIGVVEDGECTKVVPGVMAYSFKITAKDELHSTCSLGIQVSDKGMDKGGRALFGKSPAKFNALTLSGQYDASEVVEGVPVAAKMTITHSSQTTSRSSSVPLTCVPFATIRFEMPLAVGVWPCVLQHAAYFVVGSSRIHMRNKMCELILEHHIVRLFIILLFYSKKKTLIFFLNPCILVNCGDNRNQSQYPPTQWQWQYHPQELE